MSILLDGKKLAEQLTAGLKAEVAKANRPPKIAVFLVGDDAPSKKYVELKKIKAEQIGILFDLIDLKADVKEESLLALIHEKNNDPNTDAILVQVPLPKHLDQTRIINSIAPLKDVDAMGLYQVGAHTMDITKLIACTPKGILGLLTHYGVPLEGANVVIINRSGTVGLPVSRELLHNNATVTIAHRFTKNLAMHTKLADIVIVAVGIPKFLTKEMVSKNAVIIDVGTNFNAQGKVVGDADFENLNGYVKAITPNPGGIGPMTVISLMSNVLICYGLNKAMKGKK